MSKLFLTKWFKYVTKDLLKYILSDPKDFYLVSFPKCGATWLQFILSQIFIYHTNSEEDYKTVNLTELTKNTPNIPNIVWTHDRSEILYENGKRPDPYELFYYPSRLRFKKNKIIFLIRDPRDVIVSHYHQVTKRSKNPMDFNSLSEFIRDPIFGFNRIIQFYKIWAINMDFVEEHLLVKYENLISDGVEEIRKIIEFIDYDGVDHSIIEKAYENSRSEKMRKLEKSGEIKGMKKFGSSDDTLKVRKAKTGTFLEEMEKDDIKYCQDLMTHLPTIFNQSYHHTLSE